MFHRFFAHVRAHTIAYLALFFALSGTSAAAVDGLIGGNAKVFSNRMEVAPFGDWASSGVAGPTLLTIPGFGQIFLATCTEPAIGGVAILGFRNTTGRDIDAPTLTDFDPSTGTGDSDFIFQPGQAGEISGAAAGPSLASVVLGAGTGNSRAVATVTASGLADPVTNTCRFQAQVLVSQK